MVIGISGKMGAGKDEVARIINEALPHCEVKRFADALKDIVCLILGCTREELENREFKESILGPEWDCYKVTSQDPLQSNKLFLTQAEAKKYMEAHKISGALERFSITPRSMMQLLGTEGGRGSVHPNIWVNALFANYGKETKVDPLWVIPDLRFPNEALRIQSLGGVLIRVSRSGLTSVSNHSSETSLDKWENWNYKIQNDGTLKDLQEKVHKILKKEDLWQSAQR